MEGRVSHPELAVRPWRRDIQVIIAAPGHPLVENCNAEAVAAAEWILREPGSGTREAFDAWAEALPFTPKVVMTVGGNELLKRAVAGGEVIGCLSRAAVQAELGRGELSLIEPPGAAIERILSIVLPRRLTPQPALLRFLERCQASADPELWS